MPPANFGAPDKYPGCSPLEWVLSTLCRPSPTRRRVRRKAIAGCLVGGRGTTRFQRCGSPRFISKKIARKCARLSRKSYIQVLPATMALPVLVLARGFASTGAAAAAIKHVTIVGGGLMGSGIAQVSAQHGNQVSLVDLSDEVLDKSRQNIETSLKRVAKKMFKDDAAKGEQLIKDTLSRIELVVDIKSAVKKTDLVLEAIVEKLEVKQALFSAIEDIAPEHVIFASNTSSLCIRDIASESKRKDRFGGLHFFNPVPVMKLLEVVRTPDTSDETYEKLIAWGAAIGKTTVTCKDTPGFIVNRLLIPYSSEAIGMLERGDASARDIDTAMKLGAGYPMGPIELADYTGLDTGLFIREAWAKKFPDNPAFKPSKLVNKLVSEGKLGRKTGEGFYKY